MIVNKKVKKDANESSNESISDLSAIFACTDKLCSEIQAVLSSPVFLIYHQFSKIVSRLFGIQLSRYDLKSLQRLVSYYWRWRDDTNHSRIIPCQNIHLQNKQEYLIRRDARKTKKDREYESNDKQKQVDNAYDYLQNKSIDFVLPTLKSAGGPSVVIELARQLGKLNIDVGIVNLGKEQKIINGVKLIEIDSAAIRSAHAVIASSWPTIESINELSYNSAFRAQKILFCQSDEPTWWPISKRSSFGYPGDQWSINAEAAFRSKDFKHIVIADSMFAFKEKYGFDIVGKVRIVTPRKSHLYAVEKARPNWNIGFINRGKKLWFKGKSDALEVIMRIKERFPWISIHAIGFQPRDKELAKLGVHYVENPTDSAINDFYNRIDVFMSYSYIEGCPLPPQEAMICGCPVVTTPIGVENEYDVVDGDPSCILVEPGSIYGFVDAVSTLLCDVELWRNFRENGIRCMQSRTVNNMVGDFARGLHRAMN